MVNLSTPNDILFRELMADKEKSHYWLRKKCGGDKAYEKMRDRLLVEAKKERRTKISDVIGYRSANGNRWMTYECARYFPGARESYTLPYAFCFYETLGSAGAFVPVKIGLDDENGEDAIVIFTSHFFYQMCERLGIKYRSPEMVRLFHEYIPLFMMSTYKDEEDNDRTKLIIRIPGAIGWGFKREGNPLVFEVRTFLADTQLNNKQKRITQELRKRADKFSFEPKEVTKNRLMKKIAAGESISEDFMQMIDKYKAIGYDEDYINESMNVISWMVVLFTELGLVKAEDSAFWERHASLNKDIVNDYIVKGKNDAESFLTLAEECAKNDGFRKFDKDKAREILYAKIKEANMALQQIDD